MPSHLDNHTLALDPIKDARVINRHVLLSDDLDNFLRHHTSSQCSNVM
jgi:hypothetical protein